MQLADKVKVAGVIIANGAIDHRGRDIYSTRPDYTQATLEPDFNVWAISISGDAGEALVAKINQASGTYSTKLTFDRSVEKKDLKIGNGVAGFSQWGPTPTLRLKPEVVAPAENILSTEQVDESGSKYGYQSGTSFSTLITSAVSALAIYRQKELAPTLEGMDKTMIRPKVAMLRRVENWNILHVHKVQGWSMLIKCCQSMSSSPEKIQISPYQMIASMKTIHRTPIKMEKLIKPTATFQRQN